MNKKNIPRYPFDTDYTTNAPSISQMIARFNKALNHLTDRLENVEVDYKDLLLQWVNDGTLEDLIIEGAQGEKGDPFKYDDFTPEQLEKLKGERGKPFTYEDFSPVQLKRLKGDKGDTFTFDDLTPDEVEKIKGDKGGKGDPFLFSDYTDEQLERLRGRRGEKGDPFKYEDFTPEQLDKLKGDKGAQGDRGDSGIITEISGMFSISSDKDGNMWVNYVDGEIVPKFEVMENGDIYYIIDEEVV